MNDEVDLAPSLLHRGKSRLDLRIVSDVTGWGESPDDSYFDTTIGTMEPVGSSGWYHLETRVAPRARIEYLVVYGETDYRVDPLNPRRAWSRGGHDHGRCRGCEERT